MAISAGRRTREDFEHEVGTVDPIGFAETCPAQKPDERHPIRRNQSSAIVDGANRWFAVTLHHTMDACNADVLTLARPDPLLDCRERQFHIDGADRNAEDVCVAWHNPRLAGQTIIPEAYRL